MPQFLNESILAKSGGAGSWRLQWTRAAEGLRSAGASWEDVAYFVDGLASPASLEALAWGFDASGEPSLARRMVELVDESSYPLADWMASLERVYAFLAKERRRAGGLAVLGYLSCAAEYGSARGGGLSLAQLVEEMLLEFGFQG